MSRAARLHPRDRASLIADECNPASASLEVIQRGLDRPCMGQARLIPWTSARFAWGVHPERISAALATGTHQHGRLHIEHEYAHLLLDVRARDGVPGSEHVPTANVSAMIEMESTDGSLRLVDLKATDAFGPFPAWLRPGASSRITCSSGRDTVSFALSHDSVGDRPWFTYTGVSLDSQPAHYFSAPELLTFLGIVGGQFELLNVKFHFSDLP